MQIVVALLLIILPLGFANPVLVPQSFLPPLNALEGARAAVLPLGHMPLPAPVIRSLGFGARDKAATGVFTPKAGNRPDHSSEFSYLDDLDFFTEVVEKKPVKKTTVQTAATVPSVQNVPSADVKRESFLEAFDKVMQNHYISGPFIDKFFPSYLQAIQKLGQGTYGSTFLVMDRTYGDYFALKAFYITLPADSRKSVELSTPRMIENEWRILNSKVVDLGHGDIITTAKGTKDERQFIPMKFVKGVRWDQDFKSMLPSHEEIEQRDQEIAIKILHQMSKLHENGIVHRDVAMRNVILESETLYPDTLNAVIVDYGLAKQFSLAPEDHQALQDAIRKDFQQFFYELSFYLKASTLKKVYDEYLKIMKGSLDLSKGSDVFNFIADPYEFEISKSAWSRK